MKNLVIGIAIACVTMTSTASTPPSSIDLSKKDALVGRTIHFDTATVEFSKSAYKSISQETEYSVTGPKKYTVECQGTYEVKRFLRMSFSQHDTRFIEFKIDKCISPNTDHGDYRALAFYVEAPKVLIASDNEFQNPAIVGSLSWMENGKLYNRRTLVGTGDYIAIQVIK